MFGGPAEPPWPKNAPILRSPYLPVINKQAKSGTGCFIGWILHMLRQQECPRQINRRRVGPAVLLAGYRTCSANRNTRDKSCMQGRTYSGVEEEENRLTNKSPDQNKKVHRKAVMQICMNPDPDQGSENFPYGSGSQGKNYNYNFYSKIQFLIKYLCIYLI